MALINTAFKSDSRNTCFDIFLCWQIFPFEWSGGRANCSITKHLNSALVASLSLLIASVVLCGPSAEVESPGNPKPHTWINTLYVHWKGKPPVYFYLFCFRRWRHQPLSSRFFFLFLNWRALEFKRFLSKPWCLLELLAPGRCYQRCAHQVVLQSRGVKEHLRPSNNLGKLPVYIHPPFFFPPLISPKCIQEEAAAAP